jgi:hypothetical protein
VSFTINVDFISETNPSFSLKALFFIPEFCRKLWLIRCVQTGKLKRNIYVLYNTQRDRERECIVLPTKLNVSALLSLIWYNYTNGSCRLLVYWVKFQRNSSVFPGTCLNTILMWTTAIYFHILSNSQCMITLPYIP